MRINFDRGIDPEPRYNTPADELEAAGREIRHQAHHQRQSLKDDDEDGREGRDGREDDDDIRPEDYTTQEEYEDALDDAGIDPDDAEPWPEEDGTRLDALYPAE